jgi:hypothetical protein
MVSQPFCHDVAKSYRNIFGGKIISVREKEQT